MEYVGDVEIEGIKYKKFALVYNFEIIGCEHHSHGYQYVIRGENAQSPYTRHVLSKADNCLPVEYKLVKIED